MIKIPHTDITISDEECKQIVYGTHPLSFDYTLNVGYHTKTRRSELIRMDIPPFSVQTKEYGTGMACVAEVMPTCTHPIRFGIKLDSGTFSHFKDGIAYFYPSDFKTIG